MITELSVKHNRLKEYFELEDRTPAEWETIRNRKAFGKDGWFFTGHPSELKAAAKLAGVLGLGSLSPLGAKGAQAALSAIGAKGAQAALSAKSDKKR